MSLRTVLGVVLTLTVLVVAALAGGGTDDDRDARTTAVLPPQATRVLELIDAGGPFPYRQDGGVFGNREGLLPEQPRGYYREYTVETPGSPDRGARRLVTGGDPPTEVFYTDDHYDSFTRVPESELP